MNPTKEKEPAVVGATASSIPCKNVNTAESAGKDINNITYKFENVNIPNCVIRAVEDSARVCLALGQLTGSQRYYAERAELNAFLSEIEEVFSDG